MTELKMPTDSFSSESVRDFLRQAAQQRLVTLAAITLGCLPKKRKRKWTGWIGRDHCWRGRRVVLPDGQVGEVMAVLRGRAAVVWADPHWIEGERRAVFPVSKLKVFKNPAAALLGRLKRGLIERKSERKVIACRRNASMPPRPGSRPRGRPRKFLNVRSATSDY